MEYKINSCSHDIKKFIKEIIEEYNFDYWDEWLEEQDYDVLKEKPNILVSVEDNNKLIGVCSIKKINNDDCLLNTFYVRKEYRNKGIGTKLFNTCEEYAKKNYKGIFLTVDPTFKKAIEFYEKRNYIYKKYNPETHEITYYKEVL